ncbi:hypothetical protein B7494_g822 [Chlorociboria aeruginascens]|nr:hypothetical protein B7494_g822 [Chlorociboria aeruginascens]
MPSASHPQAQFIPISPDLDLNTLVENTPNFDFVVRLPNEKLQEQSVQNLESLVLSHVILNGRPLVIEGWGSRLPTWQFSQSWLEENLGKKVEKVRDIPSGLDIPMTVGHYLKSLKILSQNITPENYRDPNVQRLYLKDIDTPYEWAAHLKDIIPESLFYLNENIESRAGGAGSILEPNQYGQMRYGIGVAPAGDLMSSLPSEMRAENMMCYIGHEGTYTPAHREMCASLGQNIMVDASRDKNGEKKGSSIWFMTETKEREVVSEYFLSMLGHDIEVEKHFAQVNAWKKAPFRVYVVEQKVGDLILIPPLAPHQVWNRGTRTMKVAWNRITVNTLQLAIQEGLPRARMVCRDEQYKTKAIIYYTLKKYSNLLQRDTLEQSMWRSGRVKDLLDGFKKLFALYTIVLINEMFSQSSPKPRDVEMLPYDSNVTCSYCRCNIFNRFLTCKTCIEHGPNGEEDTYDICMECYAMGRSCACISNLNWVEQWEESDLTMHYEAWRNIVVQSDGYFNLEESPLPLSDAIKRYGKKPVAQICQEQLSIRPWHDITEPEAHEPFPGASDNEPEVDDEGRLKKPVKKFTKGKVRPVKGKTHDCHICRHHHSNWKQAFCTTCSQSYCYGVLWRAFDLMPQSIMEVKDWQCPKCLNICSCSRCRKDASQVAYAPKGTLLGHDTRKVADFRSVESLVDFSKTNLTWLRGENDNNPHESTRMKKLKEKAEAEKAQESTIGESYLDNAQSLSLVDSFDGGMDEIDPSLRDIPSSFTSPPYTHTESNGSIDDSYASIDPVNNGGNSYLIDGANDADGYHEPEYSTNNYHEGQPETAYPSRLLSPVASMNSFAANSYVSPYPDPPVLGQTRMMGAGYYQQQGNGVDRIEYDPPNSNPSTNEAPVPTHAQLLAALPQFEEPTKKRKREGDGDDSENDLEFFSSKRQKKAAGTRKTKGKAQKAEKIENDDEMEPNKLNTTSQQPRRSGKKKSYVTLDDGLETILDKEIIIRTPKQPTKDVSYDDLELATLAMNRLAKKLIDTPSSARGHSATMNSPAPPNLASTKRGRPKGRPRVLATQNATASIDVVSDDSGNDPFTHVPVKKRRGRPARESVIAAVDVPSDEAENYRPLEVASTKKRRGRPSFLAKNTKDPPVAAFSDEAELYNPLEISAKKRKERPSYLSKENTEPLIVVSPEDSEDNNSPEISIKKKRGRPSFQAKKQTEPAIAVSSGEAETYQPPSISTKKRRGRPSFQMKAITQPLINASSDEVKSVHLMEVSTEIPRKRRGRRKEQVEAFLNKASDNLGNSDGEAPVGDVDSLFGDHLKKNGPEPAIIWHASEDNPIVQVAVPLNCPDNEQNQQPENEQVGEQKEDGEEEVVAVVQGELASIKAKPRGRPPKRQFSTSNPPQNLLSLKEKLALKGQNFKVVSRNARQSMETTSKASTAIATPSVIETPSFADYLADSPLPSPGSKTVLNGTSGLPESPSEQSYNFKSPHLNLSTSRNTSLSPSLVDPSPSPIEPTPSASSSLSPAPKPPARKGPTVVRLLSSELESEAEAPLQSSGLESPGPVSEFEGSSDDDDDIPAVKTPIIQNGCSSGISLNGNGHGRGLDMGRGKGRGISTNRIAMHRV